MFLTFAAVKPENSFQQFIPTESTYNEDKSDKDAERNLRQRESQPVQKITIEGITCSSQTGLVRVPEDHKSLKEAVMWVEKYNRFLKEMKSKKTLMTTIVVGKGEHQIDGDYLVIASTMNIVGDPNVPKENIVVMGGIRFSKGIQENCHLQHLTLGQAKKSGVTGQSSFTMKDVIVEKAVEHGVRVQGKQTGYSSKQTIGRLANVEVRDCGYHGVYALDGARVTLMGPNMKVHNNCKKYDYDCSTYGQAGKKCLTYGIFAEPVYFNYWGQESRISFTKDVIREKNIFENGPHNYYRLIHGEYEGSANFRTIATIEIT